MNNRRSELMQHFKSVDGKLPEIGSVKHEKMAIDGFLFFRGSSQLFYADIKSHRLDLPTAFYQVPLTTIMGDCHLSNFGFFTEEGSHGDNVIFAPNDFDDACIGHAIWDIARFIVSLILAQLYCQKMVKGEIQNREDEKGKAIVDMQNTHLAINHFIEAYQVTCQLIEKEEESKIKHNDVFDKTHVLHKYFNKAIRRSADGEDFTTKSRLAKAVQWSNTSISFKHDPKKYHTLTTSLRDEIIEQFSPYVDDKIIDVVSRHGAGTGSLDMCRYYLLVGPESFTGTADLALCHIVEIKQQRIAAPLQYFNRLSDVNRLNPAHLTIQCQRKMQTNPDLVLNEVYWQNHYWLVRSRHHTKVGIDPENIYMGKKALQIHGVSQYATVCAQTLAQAHCRGDRRSVLFEKAISKALKHHKADLITACVNYSKQVLQDTQYLKQTLKK